MFALYLELLRQFVNYIIYILVQCVVTNSFELFQMFCLCVCVSVVNMD